MPKLNAHCLLCTQFAILRHSFLQNFEHSSTPGDAYNLPQDIITYDENDI